MKVDQNQCGGTTVRMETARASRRCRHAVGMLAVLLTTSSLAQAQAEKVNAVIGEQVRTEQAAQASQKRIAALDGEASSMLAEYRQANAEIGGLKAYNDQLAEQVKSQEAELAAMTQQLTEIETTSREALPMMQKMVATLGSGESWNKFFPVRGGHWGGWELESYPVITEINFTNAERTRASAKVTIGYSGATVELEKQARRWIALRLTNRWVT